MFIIKRKTWMNGLVVFSALLAGGMIAAEPSGQAPAPAQKPLSEDERRKAMERLVEQLQKERGATQVAALAKPEPAQAPPAAAPAAVAPPPAPRPPTAGGLMQLNYDNADLYDFINQIADQLGYSPLVIDPEVKGSVTIHSTAPMSKDDVVPLFNLILKNNNVALVKQGNIYQIVPISSGLKKGVDIIDLSPETPPAPPAPKGQEKTAAKTPPAPAGPAAQAPGGKPAPTPTAPAAAQAAAPEEATVSPINAPLPPPIIPVNRIQSGRLATYVVRAEFVPVKDLVDPLKLFMTDGGVIMPYERLNMLIITDYGESVKKLVDIVKLFDDNYLNPDLVELIKIKYNAASDVLDDLKKIFGSGGKDSPTGVNFVSLDRLNSILVMANSKRALEEVKRWIGQLDNTTGRSVQTYVYTVENSTAANIATILAALYGGDMSGGAGGGTSPGGTPGTMGGGVGGTGLRGSTGYSSTGTGGYQTPFGNTGASTSAAGGYGGFGQSSFGGMQGGLGGYGGYGGYGGMGMGGGFMGVGSQLGPRLGGSPSMTTTMLRGGAFTGLQDVVRIVADDINNTLIIQASQADYAYLAETIKKLDVLPRQVIIDARVFEVDLNNQLSYGVSASLGARGTGQQLTTAGIDSTGALSAGTFAFIGSSREILANISALRSKTKVRVLQAPSVLALDGTMAQIVVGGEVPYPGASYIPAAGGATSSVQYRDIGVSLIVMPRISASGSVTLQIAQEISSPGTPTPGDTLGPTFNKTSVNTTLSVKDGETVAIAGLITNHNSVGRAGVPLLSEIPLLGSLFGQSTASTTRTEVLILITPHVIKTPERFDEMSQELKDSLRNVRRLVDKTDQQHTNDMESAEKQRARQEAKEQEKEQKKNPPPQN